MRRVRLRALPSSQPIDALVEEGGVEGRRVYTLRASGLEFGAEVEHYDDGSGHLRVDGRILPFHMATDRKVIHVWVKGSVHALEIEPLVARGRSSPESAAPIADISAPMPGTILQIRVSPGEIFEAHQPLIIMESMKMEMTLSAPRTGRVRAIACAPGQLVEMGAILIRVERLEPE